MPKKTKVVATSDQSESLFTQYNVVTTKLKNTVGVSMLAREADLKKAKDLMDSTHKSADFVLIYDGNGLNLDVRVGNTSDNLQQVNFDSDRNAHRETLVKLNKYYPDLVPKTEIDAFDKANPDPQQLADLKQQIADEDKEIKDLEAKLKAAKQKRDELDKQYKAIGGK